MHHTRFKKGISTPELLVVLFLMTLLATLVYYSLSGFKNKQALEANVRQVTALLEEARSLTLSGRGGLAYSVYFQADRVVRFSGSVYATSSTDNVPYLLDSSVTISSISLVGGGPSVLFDKITGKTTTSGTIQLIAVGATSTKKTIVINSTGIIDTQ